MDLDVRETIHEYASKGVLVDTNILLLYVVGCFDPERIPRFKRTKQFQIADFVLLQRFLAIFHRRVTTPWILAEVSSLASQLGEPAKHRCMQQLAEDIQALDERYEPSSQVVCDDAFPSMGITDTAIQRVAQEGLLVLTDDYRLTNRLLALGISALNFNHLRALE